MRFKQEFSGQWVQPRMRRYLMKCCDCGLVHRMEFRVLKLTSRGPKGLKRGKLASGHFVQFRAWRKD